MEKYYNLREASEILGIKVRTIREWIRDGKLKAVKYKISNRLFISEDEIRRLRDVNEN